MLLILIDLVQVVHVYQSRTEQSNGPHGYIKPMAVSLVEPVLGNQELENGKLRCLWKSSCFYSQPT